MKDPQIIDETDEHGQTALHIPARQGDIESIRYICQNKAHLSTQDMLDKMSLHYAALHPRATAVKEILKSGAKDSTYDDAGKGAFHYAENQLTRWYLAFGTDPAGQSPRALMMPLMYFATVCQVKPIAELLTGGSAIEVKHGLIGWTALMVTSLQGNCEIARYLCIAGADVDNKDAEENTGRGHVETVKILLQYGGDVDHKNALAGDTAFSKAILPSSWTKGEYLSQAGSYVEAVNNGGNPLLLLCVKTRKFEAVIWLINRGIDVDSFDNQGNTALMQAAWMGYDVIVHDPLGAGASLN